MTIFIIYSSQTPKKKKWELNESSTNHELHHLLITNCPKKIAFNHIRWCRVGWGISFTYDELHQYEPQKSPIFRIETQIADAECDLNESSTYHELHSLLPTNSPKKEAFNLESLMQSGTSTGHLIRRTPSSAYHQLPKQNWHTHCNTLQHTATHCNVLQHTATHCNALQRTPTHWNTMLCMNRIQGIRGQELFDAAARSCGVWLVKRFSSKVTTCTTQLCHFVWITPNN